MSSKRIIGLCMRKMNRKKVLFFYEMRSMVYFLIAGLVVMALALFNIYYDIQARVSMVDNLSVGLMYQNQGSGCVIGNVLSYNLTTLIQVFFFGFLVMAMVQFSDLQGRGQREYLNSLPFTQGEKFGAKVFVSYGIITLCCLVFSISMISIRMHFYPQIVKNDLTVPNFMQLLGADTMWHTVRSLLLFWITLLAMYSIIMTVQYLVRNSILAALIAAGTLAFPAFLTMVAQQFLYFYYYVPVAMNDDKLRNALGLLNRIRRYACTFFGDTMGYPNSQAAYLARQSFTPVGWWQTTDQAAVSYGRVGLSFAIVIVLLVVFTLLAWWVSEHQDLARINHLVYTKYARICLGAGLSVSAGALSVFMVTTMPVAIVAWVAGSVILFFISQKILKRL